MSVEKVTNVAASVRARLKNVSERDGETFQNLLTRFGIERLLYRLSLSGSADRFILKGASLFVAWEGNPHRATRDLDLLGFGASDVDSVVAAFRAIVEIEVEPDGLVFDSAQVRGVPIKEGHKYRGVRLHLLAMLGTARVPIQVDVGFGDAVEPDEGVYPSLIGLPAARLRLYPREAVIAEKVHAMVALGLTNGRLKDYYDVWYLSSTSTFDLERLGRAIVRTFGARGTLLPTTLPEAMTPLFVEVPSKRQMWAGFKQKAMLPATTPDLDRLVDLVAAFVWPVIQGEAGGLQSMKVWKPGEGWVL